MHGAFPNLKLLHLNVVDVTHSHVEGHWSHIIYQELRATTIAFVTF